MKLPVPFLRQTENMNCGPTALKMVFSYFGDNKDFSEKMEEIKEGKAVSTIQLATISAKLGYKTELYSKHVLFNPENLKEEYYQKYSEMSMERSMRFLKNAEDSGVKVYEKQVSLEEVLSFVNNDNIPIVLLDWNVVRCKEGYLGHFVPVVGYDNENIFVHNSSNLDGQAFMSIDKKIFDKARKAKGTDEEFVILYRKI
jgi:hypothetical protein